MTVEDLERELRAERSEPSLDFAQRLDEWADAGFPRDRGLGPRSAGRKTVLGRVWDRLSSTPPRRMLLPAGAVATIVVAGIAISQNRTESTGLSAPSPPDTARSSQAEATKPVTPPAAAGGGSAGDAAESVAPGRSTDGYNLDLASPDTSGDGIARGADERIVDATARIALGADAEDVQDVANGVVEVTDRNDGVVLDSLVTSDQAGARASFELEIPYGKLDAALADLSGLADVISRTEGGEDITAHALRARKDLAETLDQIRKARVQLIEANTREQRLVIRSQIASLQASADAQQAELNGVKRQGRFATVNVDVTSNGPASGDGDWSLGDALDDAGRVLEVIGGIAVITIAILLPLALIAALAAFAVSRSRKRSRERVLGE